MSGGGARASDCGAFPTRRTACAPLRIFSIFDEGPTFLTVTKVNCQIENSAQSQLLESPSTTDWSGVANLSPAARVEASRDREPDRPESRRDFHVTARPYPLLPVREVSSPVPSKNAFLPRWDLLEILCEEQRHEDSCGNSQYTTRHACRCQGKIHLLHFSFASREIQTFLLDKYPQFVLRGKSRVSEQSNSKYRPIRSKYLSINLFLCPQIGARPYSAVLIPRVYGASSFFFSKKGLILHRSHHKGTDRSWTSILICSPR